MSSEVRVHGTYPFDSEKYPWRRVQELSVEAAGALLKLPVLEEHQREVNARYLLLNKGYVCVDTEEVGLTPCAAAILEGPGGPGVERARPVGTRAVYVHDGRYWLIERVEREAASGQRTASPRH